MKKTTSKVVSIILTLCMVMSCVFVANFAVNAQTTDVEVATSNANLQDDVQDGVILHAFNWSYNTIKENLPAIAAAGYSTVQTSPVQQPKDYGDWYKVADQWPKLYQPLNFSIATNTWLGTKEELAALCAEAEKYDVKIICDIVSNHLANNMEDDMDSANTGVLFDEIADTEPEIYNNTDVSLHSYRGLASDASVKAVVQGYLSNCPDLNTGSELIQNKVIGLLKQCIDCGVDGFRFDAAKHIETPSDGDYASDYWPNITSAATAYAQEKYGVTPYYYGEILNTCGSGRSISGYTPYINVTDNATGNNTLKAVKNGNAGTAARTSNLNSIGAASSDSVLWAESHDTYMAGETSAITDEVVIKTWALVAAQSDATSLFFARPGDAFMGEAAGNTSWKSIAVSEVNKFHNNFVGTADAVGSTGTIAYVTRGTSGIVLVNCSGTAGSISVADTGMADGTYTDTITGNTFTVAGGTITGTMGDTGVAVVYDSTTTPVNTNTVENCTFKGNSLEVTLGLVNATSGTYQINDGTPVTYTGDTTLVIGADAPFDSTITLTLTATDGTQTTTAVYKYVKTAPEGTGVYVVFEDIRGWVDPFYVYMYDEITDPDNSITNAAWPGEKMEYDEATGYYYYEVPKVFVESENTQVIINNNNGGKQYPSHGSKTKLNLEGTTHFLRGSKWTVIDFKPTVDEPTVPPTTVPETTVEPTTVEPTTVEPTTVEPTTVEPTTVEPTTVEPTTEPITTEPPTTIEPTYGPDSTTTPPETTAPADKFTVAGDCMTPAWDPASNEMTKGEYEFGGVAYDYALTTDAEEGTWNFKVTNGTWDVAYPAQNFSFTVTDFGSVTIYFNSTTHEIAVDGEYIDNSEFVVEVITAVGNGDGTWLNGASWDQTDSTNDMTEVAPGVWEITYENIDAYDSYEVKFAVNHSWTYNWTIDGVFDGQTNIGQVVEEDGSTVTLRIDINGFDFKTKEGTVVTAFEVTPPTSGPILGDVDSDGEVTIKDATLLQTFVAKLCAAEELDLTVADVNGDGFINIIDATYVQLMVAGYEIA